MVGRVGGFWVDGRGVEVCVSGWVFGGWMALSAQARY